MMNCQKTEQLIPLFVEADLDAVAMQQVTTHLEACDSCRHLAAEFQASQASLRALALPRFDEAVFAPMRTAVQHEIAHPTNMSWLALRWPRKLVWATAAACLALGGFAFYRQLLSVPETKQVAVREDRQDSAPSSAHASRAIETVPRAVASQRPTRKPSPHPTALITARGTVPAPSTAEPVTATPSPALAVTASSGAATPAAEPEMLRMEIHTADPNIKIIWLTPKEPTRTSSAADTK